MIEADETDIPQLHNTENNVISFKELYESVAKSTNGSHVQIVNAENYNQLSVEQPREFFDYTYSRSLLR